MLSAKEVWERIKGSVGISEEEFYSRVTRLSERAGITESAAALLVAKRLGVDISDILRPPIVGRVLEVGPVRESRGGAAYRLFTLVNRDELRLCVAFGHDHVRKLDGLEDRVVRITRYIVVRTGAGEITRVTESSTLEEAEESLLPPIYELEPARAPTLAQLKETRGQRIASAVVIEQQTAQIWTCPLCSKEVVPSEGEWVCSVHGPVEPEVKNLNRFQLADRTGIYQALYMGEIENVEGNRVVFKGAFRGDELYISKIYLVEPVEG